MVEISIGLISGILAIIVFTLALVAVDWWFAPEYPKNVLDYKIGIREPSYSTRSMLPLLIYCGQSILERYASQKGKRLEHFGKFLKHHYSHYQHYHSGNKLPIINSNELIMGKRDEYIEIMFGKDALTELQALEYYYQYGKYNNWTVEPIIVKQLETLIERWQRARQNN